MQGGLAGRSVAKSCHAASTLATDHVTKVSVAFVRLECLRGAIVGRWKKTCCAIIDERKWKATDNIMPKARSL